MNKTERMFTNESVISRVYGEIPNMDCSKTPTERMKNLVKQVENPGRFYLEGYEIELEWRDTQKTIQDCIRDVWPVLG